ncbi:hypothetical protein [Roseivivax marinus]|nr:hypothetical protein [Roseivivax marinus]
MRLIVVRWKWLRESGLHFGENDDLRAGLALIREPGGGAPRRPLPG